jgi:hypothetical protein
MEMEVSGGGAGGLAGALDSKTYDFDLRAPSEQNAFAAAKTQNAASDMSLVTEQMAPATIRFEANMSGIQEESELNATSAVAAPKTVNVAAPMDLDEDEDDDESDGGEKLEMHGDAKTMNVATDMDLATATTNFNARTTNFNVPMEMDEEEEEEEDGERDGEHSQGEDQNAGDALNEGFTKDWATTGNNGAKTVNFAAPMDLVEEEDEEEDGEQKKQANVSSSNESAENDNNFPAQWNLSYAGGSHLAAADAVRKSLEQGTFQKIFLLKKRIKFFCFSSLRTGELMGRSSLGRKSVDRLSLSFGARASPPPRESLNRSSLQLSPVEEANEHEEDLSPFVPPAKASQQQQQQEMVIPVKQVPRSAVSTQSGREIVAHPIAGVQVSVPQSRLPSLFDRRYSTRQIIRNFASDRISDEAAAAAEVEQQQQQQQQEELERQHISEMDYSMRRASMRQSIAPGDLPLSDFLWMAKVFFAEEQPVPSVPAAEVFSSSSSAPSLCSVEIAALEAELAQLQQTAAALRDEVAEQEAAFCGTANPLFGAVQTSEQRVLERVQAELAQLRRLSALEAETASLEAGLVGAASARALFRAHGERALRDAAQLQGGAMRALQQQREALRAPRARALQELARLREQQHARQRALLLARSAAQLLRAAALRLLGATHEQQAKQGEGEEEEMVLVLHEAVRVRVLASGAVACAPLSALDEPGFRPALLRAAALFGTFRRDPALSLFDLVRAKNKKNKNKNKKTKTKKKSFSSHFFLFFSCSRCGASCCGCTRGRASCGSWRAASPSPTRSRAPTSSSLRAPPPPCCASPAPISPPLRSAPLRCSSPSASPTPPPLRASAPLSSADTRDSAVSPPCARRWQKKWPPCEEQNNKKKELYKEKTKKSIIFHSNSSSLSPYRSSNLLYFALSRLCLFSCSVVSFSIMSSRSSSWSFMSRFVSSATKRCRSVCTSSLKTSNSSSLSSSSVRSV